MGYFDRKLNDSILIKKEIISPVNQKCTVFCQIETGMHASTIPSSWSKHNQKRTFFQHKQTRSKQVTAETQFSLKKDKNNKM